MSDAESDRVLIKETLLGNLQAYNLLVKKYQSRILAMAYKMVKERSTAEDIAQETFIKAFKALANFRQESAFYTWLYRIGMNTAKNHLSSLKHNPLHQAYQNNEEVSAFDQPYSHPQLQDNASPEHILIAKTLKQQIDHSIEQLPEELRIAFLLREQEGLSYEDISLIMECPIGTVRSRIFRARETISEHIHSI